MSLDSFSEDLFKALTWVNGHRIEGPVEQKQAQVASLVSKLRIYVEQINFALEKSSLHLINIMPPIMNDVQTIQTEVQMLMSTMNQMQTDVEQANHDTVLDLANFKRFETIYQKLFSAKHGIQESDGWSKLTAELDGLLEQNDVERSADKFRILNNSLQAQKRLPGQKEREQQLIYYTNRIEAILSSSIIQSIRESNSVEYNKQADVLNAIGRSSQVSQYYRNVHRNDIIDKWIKIAESTGSLFPNLVSFHDFVLHFFHQQQKWCLKTNVNPKLVLDVVVDALLHITDMRKAAVNMYFEQHSDKFVFLSELSQINLRFLTALEHASKDEKIDIALTKDLSQAVFGYSASVLDKLFLLEKEFSREMLENFSVVDIAENIRSLDNRGSRVAKWTEDALCRCKNVTRSQGLYKYISIFQNFFENYVELFNSIQQNTYIAKSNETDWNLIHLHINLLHCLGVFVQTIEKTAQTIAVYADEFDLTEYALYASMLSSTEKNNEIILKIVNTRTADRQSVVFPKYSELIGDTAAKIHDTIMKLVLCPVEQRFEDMQFSKNNTCEEFDLPNYSYAPQEYVTQIGQYLLTLPQHLEPLLLAPSPTLKRVMDCCDKAYGSEKLCADVLLSLIVAETVALYQDKIDNIPCLSSNASKQLAVDIEYFLNVLEEISLPCNDSLQQTATLLMASPDQYNTTSIGCDPVLVTKIRQKRSIISR